MNINGFSLKTATFLTAASAALWIGSAVAAPLPLSYAGDIGASFAALFSSQRSLEATDDVPANYPSDLRRQVIAYRTSAAAGTVIIDTNQTYLYFVLGNGTASGGPDHDLLAFQVIQSGDAGGGCPGVGDKRIGLLV